MTRNSLFQKLMDKFIIKLSARERRLCTLNEFRSRLFSASWLVVMKSVLPSDRKVVMFGIRNGAVDSTARLVAAIFLCSVICACSVCHQQYYVRSLDSGFLYGPFSFDDGARCSDVVRIEDMECMIVDRDIEMAVRSNAVVKVQCDKSYVLKDVTNGRCFGPFTLEPDSYEGVIKTDDRTFIVSVPKCGEIDESERLKKMFIDVNVDCLGYSDFAIAINEQLRSKFGSANVPFLEVHYIGKFSKEDDELVNGLKVNLHLNNVSYYNMLKRLQEADHCLAIGIDKTCVALEFRALQKSW